MQIVLTKQEAEFLQALLGNWLDETEANSDGSDAIGEVRAIKHAYAIKHKIEKA